MQGLEVIVCVVGSRGRHLQLTRGQNVLSGIHNCKVAEGFSKKNKKFLDLILSLEAVYSAIVIKQKRSAEFS